MRRDGDWKIVHSHWAYVGHRLPERVTIPLPLQLPPAAFEGVLGEIFPLEVAAMARWCTGDPWGFIEVSAPDVTCFDTGTPQRLNGRDTLRAEYAQRAGKTFDDVMDFVDPQVRVCGDVAVLVYQFLSTWLNRDGSIASRTPWNCTEVFARLSGDWRIIHTQWSFVRGERF